MSPKLQAANKNRWRMLSWSLLLVAVVIAAVLGLHGLMEEEPLTSQEMLRKENWSEEELTLALSRTFTPQSNMNSRNEVVRHLRAQLEHYSEEQRNAIRNRALTMALGESLKQFRVMPVTDRQKLLSSMYERAERTYLEVNRMSDSEKDKLREELRNPAVAGLNQEIQRMMHKEFTAAEQLEFAPITKLWIRTLKEIH